MGKSTITNALLPRRLRAGGRDFHPRWILAAHHHHAQLYHLDADSHLIDSPGLQGIRPAPPHAPDLIHGFPNCAPISVVPFS